MKPPIAKRIPQPHTTHGDVREDDFYWMNDRNDPDIIRYLEEENQYYDANMEPLKKETDDIYQRMLERIPNTEERVPVQHGPYFYYSRLDKDKQYPVDVRKQASNREQLDDAYEEELLDLNKMTAEGDYLNITAQRIHPEHTHLAYLENRDGTDRYTIYIKNVETGQLLPDTIPNVFIFGSIEWSWSGDSIFYITVDANQRPYQLWQHRLGEDTFRDELLFEEKDTTFILWMEKSQSGEYIFVQSRSKTSSELRILNTDSSNSSLQLVDARREGIEYEVGHWGNHFLILTNEEAPNFQLLQAPIDNIYERETIIEPNTDRYFLAMYPFRDALLLFGRENGLTQIWMLKNGNLERIRWDEPLYTVVVLPGQTYDATDALIQYESLLTPKTTYRLNLATEKKHILQVKPVSGDYDPSAYQQDYIWATAEDGEYVPMTIVHHKDALDYGPAPLILEGYGSYGVNNDPGFDPYRLPLLDKGVVYATAQIRGGSEKGRHWYENGKLFAKRHTFTDFIAAANHLINMKYTTPSQMAALGRSAGGMLVGAVANMASDLFNVIVAEVPFVDVVTTMLDDTIPLTTLEWDEWGNPNNEEYYFYMKSYSPYDNVGAKRYPHMYVTTGLNDPRVAYWEPAKWVARLRALKSDNNTLVLKTNMGAGHFGESGRFSQLKEEAALYAFILDKIGAKTE